ncbi:hypothetical protein TrST_g6607 [Triparma strigata]|uniref:Glycosyltransferase 61 catalytic domain-containing protein n=1 Tax=Triparma strigata TaxID=1606541 RepID=A0A9W7EVJ6_9STRA|nr:hypothetical protein TrST_g6607 [Triparma strigata]
MGIERGEGCETKECIVDYIMSLRVEPRRDEREQHRVNAEIQAAASSSASSSSSTSISSTKARLAVLLASLKAEVPEYEFETAQPFITLPIIDCVEPQVVWDVALNDVYLDGELRPSKLTWEECAGALLGAAVVDVGSVARNQPPTHGDSIATLPTGNLEAHLKARCPTYSSSVSALVSNCSQTDLRSGYRNASHATLRHVSFAPPSKSSLLIASANITHRGNVHTAKWRIRLPGCHHTPSSLSTDMLDRWNSAHYWDRRFQEIQHERLSSSDGAAPHVLTYGDDHLVISVASYISDNFAHIIIDSLFRLVAVVHLVVSDSDNAGDNFLDDSVILHLGTEAILPATGELLRALLVGAVAERHPEATKTTILLNVEEYVSRNVLKSVSVSASRVLIAGPTPCLVFDSGSAARFSDLVGRGFDVLNGDKEAVGATRRSIVLVNRGKYSRQLLNFDTLSAELGLLADRLGYDFVDALEPPSKAFETIRNVALLVGPRGAAFMNMLLAPRDLESKSELVVLELWGGRGCETCMARLADALSLTYAALPLRAPAFEEVDVDIVVEAAEFLLSNKIN